MSFTYRTNPAKQTVAVFPYVCAFLPRFKSSQSENCIPDSLLQQGHPASAAKQTHWTTRYKQVYGNTGEKTSGKKTVVYRIFVI